MNFSPIKVPEVDEIRRDPAALVRFLRELQAEIQSAAIRATDRVPFRVLHAAPERTQAGDVCYFDGTDYDPGSGAGLYRRNEANTAWTHLG